MLDSVLKMHLMNYDRNNIFRCIIIIIIHHFVRNELRIRTAYTMYNRKQLTFALREFMMCDGLVEI